MKKGIFFLLLISLVWSCHKKTEFNYPLQITYYNFYPIPGQAAVYVDSNIFEYGSIDNETFYQSYLSANLFEESNFPWWIHLHSNDSATFIYGDGSEIGFSADTLSYPKEYVNVKDTVLASFEEIQGPYTFTKGYAVYYYNHEIDSGANYYYFGRFDFDMSKMKDGDTLILGPLSFEYGIFLPE